MKYQYMNFNSQQYGDIVPHSAMYFQYALSASICLKKDGSIRMFIVTI